MLLSFHVAGFTDLDDVPPLSPLQPVSEQEAVRIVADPPLPPDSFTLRDYVDHSETLQKLVLLGESCVYSSLLFTWFKLSIYNLSQQYIHMSRSQNCVNGKLYSASSFLTWHPLLQRIHFFSSFCVHLTLNVFVIICRAAAWLIRFRHQLISYIHTCPPVLINSPNLHI